MKILALDLGAKTGWCLLWDGEVAAGGVVEFKGDRHTRFRQAGVLGQYSWIVAGGYEQD